LRSRALGSQIGLTTCFQMAQLQKIVVALVSSRSPENHLEHRRSSCRTIRICRLIWGGGIWKNELQLRSKLQANSESLSKTRRVRHFCIRLVKLQIRLGTPQVVEEEAPSTKHAASKLRVVLRNKTLEAHALHCRTGSYADRTSKVRIDMHARTKDATHGSIN